MFFHQAFYHVIAAAATDSNNEDLCLSLLFQMMQKGIQVSAMNDAY